MVKVFKFGGASVKDSAAIQNVAEILTKYPEDSILVVISAMGKTTNKLEEVVSAYQLSDEALFLRLINDLEAFHSQILLALFSDRQRKIYQIIETIFNQLRMRFSKPFSENYSFEYDQIVSLGEVLSSRIIDAYLTEKGFSSVWTDARSLLRTDNNYQEGNVDWKKTEELIQQNLRPLFTHKKIIVSQGFVGHTSEGMTTTLGREGSDYTAGIFAHCMHAESVTIWKDVPGMLNADPKLFEDTVLLKQISFKEAIELSYYGASVIHPKTVKPLQNKNIPLYVKSFIKPDEKGTVIQANSDFDSLVPSYILKFDQVLYTITPKDFSFLVEENLSGIFKRLADAHAKINMMQNSALSFSILLDRKKVNPDQVLQMFSDSYHVKYNEGLELITIRHYDESTIQKVTKNKEILVQQRTRQTARLVVKKIE
ncbi:MAG: aspartate kinase [Bacteroidetes bacterium]|nr:aspartate kinase [Bacteroidota bacterium]